MQPPTPPRFENLPDGQLTGVDWLHPRRDGDFRLRRLRDVAGNVDAQRDVDRHVRRHVLDDPGVDATHQLGVVMLPVVVARAAELLPIRDVDVGRAVEAVLRNDDPQADLSPRSGRRKQRLILVELDGQVRVFSRRGQARRLEEAIFKG